MKKIAFIILFSLIVLSGCKKETNINTKIHLVRWETIEKDRFETEYMNKEYIDVEGWSLSTCSECGKTYYHFEDAYKTKCEPCTPLEEKVK